MSDATLPALRPNDNHRSTRLCRAWRQSCHRAAQRLAGSRPHPRFPRPRKRLPGAPVSRPELPADRAQVRTASVSHDADSEAMADLTWAPGRGHAGAAKSVPRELIRIVYRDPEHICERMTLFASHRLAEPSREWAQQIRAADPRADLREIANGLGTQSARIARIEGAVAGTPFYVALVPGYINYLWQEVRMTLRLAALYGRDPSTLRTATEALWLRGVYPSQEAAEAGLLAVQAQPLPQRPTTRRPLRMWIRSVRRILVFGGFLSPPSGTPHHGWRSWLRDALGVVLGVASWVITWIFPATFMIAMAWGCHTHARRLFRTALEYYSGEATPAKSARELGTELRHQTRRQVAHSAALSVSILLPIGFLVYATHVESSAGFNVITAPGVLVAISVVLALSMYGRR
jgi:hypothetical protein